ncbi:phenylacetate--CoA ligase family protein [Pseudoxanthomonas sacheonensis]|uniref:Phenylacetate-CoA ligase n=1 Tax=Pseudoxanthomonas sacheonensis TaxID=443615 RepID=A0ABU1RNZ2_9GAMM|nr:phenylacetate--CoA ligase family protein [Pseudoxanthomonas sacheonensis]MDR6840327.1 phenylacetate-CoA ligase [Pseudoxanthomonas sacheonensis]
MSGFYEPLFRRVLFPIYESGLRRRKTLDYLREYERSQWRTLEETEALQWRKLQDLIRHCWEQVPYYRERWQALGIAAPEDIAGPADYARLPVLNKPEIRANFDKLIAPGYRDGMLYKTTGGSTGEPLRFGYTRESYERRLSIMWRGYGWAGARLGQRTLYLWGTSIGAQKRKDRLYHAGFNRYMLNAFEMSEARMAEYADAIDRFRPETIVSYVAPIVKMAEWLITNGRRIHRPQRILGAAETLHESQRRIIEQAFGCPAYNTYGCREFMLIAAECEHRGGLHVNADHLKVELGAVNGEGQDESGPRDIIVTDLHNYGMPLLRYANGDLATAGPRTCACGRGLPLLASVDGRKLDALRTRDGRFVPGEYIVYAFLYATGIKRYQVVQKQLDTFEIRIVRDRDFEPSAIDLVRRELLKVVGDSVALNFEFVDEIPLTQTGKLRVTISELP